MVKHVLTTTDNPFNPITQFNEWFSWDTATGHHTLALLARVSIPVDNLSDSDQSLAIEEAINEIIRENVSGVHLRVSADTGLPEANSF